MLPSVAMVKLDFRLVPDLTPELVLRLLREHLDRWGYADIGSTPAGMVGARFDVTPPLVQTAIAGSARSTATSRSSIPRTAALARCTRWCRASARPPA